MRHRYDDKTFVDLCMVRDTASYVLLLEDAVVFGCLLSFGFVHMYNAKSHDVNYRPSSLTVLVIQQIVCT